MRATFGLRQPELPLFKTLGSHRDFFIANYLRARAVLKSGGSDHRTPNVSTSAARSLFFARAGMR